MKKNLTLIGLLVLTALAMAIMTGCVKDKTVAVFGQNGAAPAPAHGRTGQRRACRPSG